jgi:hypothetical protein
MKDWTFDGEELEDFPTPGAEKGGDEVLAGRIF